MKLFKMSLVSGRRFKFVLAIFFCSHALHYWHHEAKATQMSSLYPNVALKKLTFQGPGTRRNSGALDPDMYKSFRAVDGNDSTEESDCAQTTNGTVSWWLVDLYALLHIRGVAILNTNDKLGQYPDFIVDVFEQDPRKDSNFLGLEGTRCPFSFDPFGEEEWVEIDCSFYGTVSGRFIRVMKIGNERLSLCEVQVYATLLTVKSTFSRFPGLKSLAEPQEDMGVFTSPDQCAVMVLLRPDLDAFNFNRISGACKGRNSMSESSFDFAMDEEWINFDKMLESESEPPANPVEIDFGEGDGEGVTFGGGTVFIEPM